MLPPRQMRLNRFPTSADNRDQVPARGRGPSFRGCPSARRLRAPVVKILGRSKSWEAFCALAGMAAAPRSFSQNRSCTPLSYSPDLRYRPKVPVPLIPPTPLPAVIGRSGKRAPTPQTVPHQSPRGGGKKNTRIVARTPNLGYNQPGMLPCTRSRLFRAKPTLATSAPHRAEDYRSTVAPLIVALREPGAADNGSKHPVHYNDGPCVAPAFAPPPPSKLHSPSQPYDFTADLTPCGPRPIRPPCTSRTRTPSESRCTYLSLFSLHLALRTFSSTLLPQPTDAL